MTHQVARKLQRVGYTAATRLLGLQRAGGAITLLFALAACPVQTSEAEQLVFPCLEDRQCAAGASCQDGFCVGPDPLDAGATDQPAAQDRAALPDRSHLDLLPTDTALTDTELTDAAGQDAGQDGGLDAAGTGRSELDAAGSDQGGADTLAADGAVGVDTAAQDAGPVPVTQLPVDLGIALGSELRAAQVETTRDSNGDPRVLVGPSADGSAALSLSPDGQQVYSLDFAFTRDSDGNISTNSCSETPACLPLHHSIGHAGCAANSLDCGPDNENGRGMIGAGLIAGQPWHLVAGGRSSGDLDYIYLSPDPGGSPTFRHVDLSAALGGASKGVSAMHVLNDAIYLGFPDSGGARPYLLRLQNLPGPTGMDAASNSDVVNLDCKDMPGVGKAAATTIIDVISSLNGLLYVFNNGGCMRVTVATPPSYSSGSAQWSQCTPDGPPWTFKVSVTTDKTAGIEPADRAFPGAAVYRGGLVTGRNTTDGPQLWSCDPNRTIPTLGCDAGDWSHIAPNSSGDALLSQFDNSNNTSLSMVVATSSAVYVGYDNPDDGVVVFRSTLAAPATRADFTGAGGCDAALHPTSCGGVGGNGFGQPQRFTRIFDATVVVEGENEYVYLVVGDGTQPPAVVRLAF